MTIQSPSPNTLTLKIGPTTVGVEREGKLTINDRLIDGPGEYDIGGVGIHVLSDYALFFGDGLRLAAVWGNGKLRESGEETDIPILLLLGSDLAAINSLIKEQDPQVVILTEPGVAEGLVKEDAISLTRTPSYKITPQTLPETERAFILLTR